MKKKFVCLVLTTALISACGKAEPPSQASASAEIAAPAPAPPAKPSGDAILVGGYMPAFPHKVRSMREDSSSHFVVVEYLGLDRDAAITSLSESLSKDGFDVRGPKLRDAGAQYVYVHADGRRLDAIFADPSTQELVNPDARGIVMFSWIDGAAN